MCGDDCVRCDVGRAELLLPEPQQTALLQIQLSSAAFALRPSASAESPPSPGAIEASTSLFKLQSLSDLENVLKPSLVNLLPVRSSSARVELACSMELRAGIASSFFTTVFGVMSASARMKACSSLRCHAESVKSSSSRSASFALIC
eukprot:COSAG04_NODE_629_length_11765_cov_11.121721_5_plen_147_part_00